MNSNPLVVGTYKRYKASTNKLVTWLVQTAASVSSPHGSVSKTAKQHNLTFPHQIPVDRLVPLAKAIVESQSRMDISLEILDVARDSVEGRKECAIWYQALSDRRPDDIEMAESNRTHQYMVTKLEEVFDMLKREVKARRPKRKKKIELVSDMGDLSNIYQHLEVEDVSGIQDDITQSAKPSGKSKSKHATGSTKTAEYELHDSDDQDKQSALYCLLRDLQQLRRQTATTWQQYKSGQISFITASHTTESAMQIASVFASELESDFPDLALFDNVIDVLGEESYVRGARGIAGNKDGGR